MSLEGKKAPAFCLEGHDGKQYRLEDFAGRTMVIYFYPRDNTPGCTREACGFRDNYDAISNDGTVLLGISKDSPASHRSFIEKWQLPFVLLSDPDATVMGAYGAYGEKISYGKTSIGTIRSTVIIGPDGVVRKHWQKVAKAEQHPAQVLEFLRTMNQQ